MFTLLIRKACLGCGVTAMLAWPLYSSAQDAPPATPPAHWQAVSINLENVPYPYPVHFLNRNIMGQEQRRVVDWKPEFLEHVRNGRLPVIANVGHNPHLQAPVLLNRELIRFLGQGS